ncbi:MAG: hypothetical protein L6Q76_03195 [Polyangiaceae bacterium]|nr:hypothetical protein [Polyangiaceae bacterium]
MADGEDTTNIIHPIRPKIEEIDSGVLIAITDRSRSYVSIYRPPASNPPTGFSSNYVYFYIQNALPTAANSTLTTTVTNPSGSPGFTATQAKSAPNGSYTNQGSAPSSSTALWVDSSGVWAFEWNVTGTGTGASGNVVFWNNSSAMLSPSSGTIRNSTSPDANVTWKSIDTLS